MRLGDIIRILPIARHLAHEGNEVLVECLPQYHEFFECVSYCRPSLLSQRKGHEFGMVLDFEIWPKRFNEFVASGRTWLDFVYGSNPLLAGIDRTPVFDLIDEMPSLADYGLTPDVGIFSPFGYSQRDRYTLQSLAEQAKKRIGGPFVTLADLSYANELSRTGIARNLILTAKRSAHLPRLLRDARSVLTINSAPSIICGAVRSEFWHVLSGDPQNDAISPASRIVTFDT
jgi:hypothetical protein